MPGALSRTARIAWIALAVLVVFGLWLAIASASSGLAFFYSLPVGLAAWWFGLRGALATAAICLGLYAVGHAIEPIPEFGLALAIRAAFLLIIAVVVSLIATRLSLLEHSAEELEAIRAALTPTEL
ncbi:MAG TPA: hypothetical protein VGK41_08160, partial [Solirubrobacterales bacterium]